MDDRRFRALWDRVRDDRPGADGEFVFAVLCRHYSEPCRHYHTHAHIDHCLCAFDLARPHMVEPDAVETALWFHDVIFDAAAVVGENERKSAELFLDLAGDSVSPALRRKIYDLIMITAHRDPPRNLDEAFIVDIDLSSFGMPWDRFVRDGIAVRVECSHLSDKDFFARQRAFLESLLERERFCFTDFFRERHEVRSRENIKRYLENQRLQGLS